ncbi:MAG: hypothetical protein HY462_01325 [Parcubacteria group bacterium]|nr:hypothetical protein [Parcubacteria group bacterium]
MEEALLSSAHGGNHMWRMTRYLTAALAVFALVSLAASPNANAIAVDKQIAKVSTVEKATPNAKLVFAEATSSQQVPAEATYAVKSETKAGFDTQTDGNTQIAAVDSGGANIADADSARFSAADNVLALCQNSPNPFNATAMDAMTAATNGTTLRASPSLGDNFANANTRGGNNVLATGRYNFICDLPTAAHLHA